jgi:hypothetical protein
VDDFYSIVIAAKFFHNAFLPSLSYMSLSTVLGHEEAGTSALGLTGSQEKAGSCLNKMLALYHNWKWAGQVQRMEDTRIPKNVQKAKFGGVRSVGNPRKSWEDLAQQDTARFLCCRNWKLANNDRTRWRQKIAEAKARFGL